jgi:hypothetical protein
VPQPFNAPVVGGHATVPEGNTSTSGNLKMTILLKLYMLCYCLLCMLRYLFKLTKMDPDYWNEAHDTC